MAAAVDDAADKLVPMHRLSELAIEQTSDSDDAAAATVVIATSPSLADAKDCRALWLCCASHDSNRDRLVGAAALRRDYCRGDVDAKQALEVAEVDASDVAEWRVAHERRVATHSRIQVRWATRLRWTGRE